MRAVLDPNVLVSAVISPAGPPGSILLAWSLGQFELVISAKLLGELADVLVSGDPHLTGLADHDVPVLTPKAFLARLLAENLPDEPSSP